jgi:hypothetical protein
MDFSELPDRSQPVEAIHDVKHMFGARGSCVSVVEVVEILVSELLILQDRSKVASRSSSSSI